jgi:hypothetical protein
MEFRLSGSMRIMNLDSVVDMAKSAGAGFKEDNIAIPLKVTHVIRQY